MVPMHPMPTSATIQGEFPQNQHHPTLMPTRIRNCRSKIYWKVLNLADYLPISLHHLCTILYTQVMSRLLTIKRKAIPILKKHGVKRAAVFGSVARGTATSKSDVDLLIEYQSKKKSLFDFVDLKLALEEALQCKVDLLTYSSICWQLKERILSEQVVIL
jgi:uncharacterized protein